MLQLLNTTLKVILDHANIPNLVRDADVAFERPDESFKPSTRTINLFLYDIRENTELRSNESVTERKNGKVTIGRPPLRLSCSYLVTAWVQADKTGELAVLDQHELLGEVLKVFSRMPTIEKKYLQGELKNSLYPVSLVIAQGDLMRNPAEFWSAIGGKLRPSFTLTATIAMNQEIEPVEEFLVSTKQVVLGEKVADKAEFKNPDQTEITHDIAGVVTDKNSGAVLDNVELTLIESGQHVSTDKQGRYRFSGLAKGSYKVNAVKSGYVTLSKAPFEVPGTSPTSFDLQLTPI